MDFPYDLIIACILLCLFVYSFCFVVMLVVMDVCTFLWVTVFGLKIPNHDLLKDV